MNNNKEFNQKVLDKLNKTGANKSCSRCHHDKFQLAGYSQQEIGYSPTKHTASMPVILVTCTNCYNISYHALIPLGLTHPDETE